MLKNKVVLVVEDEALNLIAIASILDKLNMRYKRNTSGADVIGQAQKMKPHPDVILLDMDLPRGNSLEIYDALKDSWELRDIPVIALAAGSLPSAMLNEIEVREFAGAIPKPFSEQAVKQVLRQVFQNSRA